MKDGCDAGTDLSRGWFDAGDYVKFNFPQAFSVTYLAWGMLEFKKGYLYPFVSSKLHQTLINYFYLFSPAILQTNGIGRRVHEYAKPASLATGLP